MAEAENRESGRLDPASLDEHESCVPMDEADMMMPMMRAIMLLSRPASSECYGDTKGSSDSAHRRLYKDAVWPDHAGGPHRAPTA